jgi:hypothetical protein
VLFGSLRGREAAFRSFGKRTSEASGTKTVPVA